MRNIFKTILFLFFTLVWVPLAPGKGFFPPKLEVSAYEDCLHVYATRVSDYETYTYVMSLLLDDSNQPRIEIVSGKGSGKILSLCPPVCYDELSVTAYMIRGKLNAELNTNIVYRLPYSVKDSAKMEEGTTKFLGNKILVDSSNIKAYCFVLSHQDTVFATRKGVILSIAELTNRRFILIGIEHDDGTIGLYSMLQNNSQMVEEGDLVFPGTPIGLMGETKQNEFRVYLSIGNPIINPNYKKTLKQVSHISYSVCFETTKGNIPLEDGKFYQPTCSTDLITAEMNPKQLKKYYSQHKRVE